MPKSGSKKGRSVTRKVKRITIEVMPPGSKSATKVSTRILGPQALVQEKEEAQRKVNEAMKGLGGRTIQQIRNAHAASSAEHPPEPIEDSYQDLQGAGDAMDVNNWEDMENEDPTRNVLHALRDFMAEHFSRKRQDQRTLHQRLMRADAGWASVLEKVTDAYLVWRYPPPPPPLLTACIPGK